MNRAKVTGFLICLVAAFELNSAGRMGHTMRRNKESDNASAHKSNYPLEAGETDHGTKVNNDEFREIMDLCNSTFPTPIEYLKELNETSRFPDEANRDSKCYLNCVFTRINLFDESGNVNMSNVEKLLFDREEDILRFNRFNRCLSQEKNKGEDVCEEAYEKVSCLIKVIIDYNKAQNPDHDRKINHKQNPDK